MEQIQQEINQDIFRFLGDFFQNLKCHTISPVHMNPHTFENQNLKPHIRFLCYFLDKVLLLRHRDSSLLKNHHVYHHKNQLQKNAVPLDILSQYCNLECKNQVLSFCGFINSNKFSPKVIPYYLSSNVRKGTTACAAR